MLRTLLTPTGGTVAGALLILAGGIVTVAGAASVGTTLAILGFALILRFRVLPARRERERERDRDRR